MSFGLPDKVEREVVESELRETRARTAIDLLKPDELARVYVYIKRKVAQGSYAHPLPAANDAKSVEPYKGDAAETFVLAHPEGVTPATIAKAIGQDTKPRGADNALQTVARMRGTVRRASGKWYPAGQVPDKVKPIPDLVLKVLADGAVLSTADIYERVAKLAPGIKNGSVAVEVTRLLDRQKIENRGRDPHSRGYLYALKSEGGATGTG